MMTGRYVVFGAGAVGCVIGGRLHAAGRDVVLIARGAHLAALQRDGLHLLTPDGPEHHRIPAFATPADAGVRSGDVVLLAMKSQDAVAALDDLAAVAPEVTVVCAQNGVANEREALRRFAEVHAMCVILPCEFVEPGVVVQWSSPLAGVLDVGRYPGGTTEVDDRIARDLRAAAFRSDPDRRVMRKKYRKLLLNLGNAVDALCGEAAHGSGLFKAARAEGEACLKAARIRAQSTKADRARRAGVTIKPIEGRERGGSSTWQSLARATGGIETDHLNGEIALLGRLHGVPTPVNVMLQRAAALAARERRPPGSTDVGDLQAQLRR